MSVVNVGVGVLYKKYFQRVIHKKVKSGLSRKYDFLNFDAWLSR